MKWIQKPLDLQGKKVVLLPLEEQHIPVLLSLSQEKRIWKHYPFDGSDPKILTESLYNSFLEREKGTQYPFVILLKESSKIIGSTRFLDMQLEHRKLEIGWTWLFPDYWGTQLNTECKLLLLTCCFEEMKATRVQLKTDEHNIRSRRAIEKIGATFEGIFRHDMVRQNSTHRNSAYYSIIEPEWAEVKANLENKLRG